MSKYKLTWKDLTLHDFKVYFFALFKAFIPKRKITNLDELEEFIQTKDIVDTIKMIINSSKGVNFEQIIIKPTNRNF